MSILHTITGSAISGIVSRLMYTAIDKISNNQPQESQRLWWILLIGMTVIIFAIVILCLKHENENKNNPEANKETFTTYDYVS